MMKIKRKMPKLASVLLCFSMVSSNLLPVYATEAVVTETSLEEAGENGNDEPENDTVNTVMLNDDVESQADSDSRYEEIEVSYSQSSTYFVTIPKTITLGADKKAAYSVKVEGDIVANKQVCVVPVDGIEDTEVFDFYMADQIAGSTKEDVVAEVSQAKFYWNHEETAAGYTETDNYVIADSLSAGKWKGTFQMEISMRTDPAHIHNYVGEVTKEPTCTEKGEKTYTCDCGDSYMEEIPAKGHHYENGECTDCGEKDPSHEHSYTETITKEPTCTEKGEKTYTCDCGDSYTEEIPAKGHHFEDGECTDCGEKDPDYHKHSYTETVTKEPTCTEAGEKTYTCDCGDSYTEEIPAKGHHFVDGECTDCGEKDPCSESHTDENEDDICDICGHEHQWVENKDVLEWVRYNPYGRAGWTKNGNTYEATFSADKTDATKSASIDFDIDVPNDVECTYSFTCPYLYKTDFMYYDSAGAYLYDLDNSGNTISDTRTTIFSAKGAGSGNSSGKISLSKGKHRLSVSYHKGNKSSAVSGKVRITLSTMEALNHVCTGCGEKRAHNYTETVIKEAICVENGEKEYVCETCGYSYVEEIEATGEHNYVNGICTMCGKANIATTEIYSISSTTSRTTDSGHGHYDQTSLSGTYSPDIEIAENMAENEYLVLNSYIGYPVIGGQGQYGESDGINGSSQLQKYDEETDTWKTIDTHTISYNIVNNITEQTGGYKDLHRGCGISRKYQLEKGTYRIYGSFSAHRSCASSVAHSYYSYRITAYLCQIDK